MRYFIVAFLLTLCFPSIAQTTMSGDVDILWSKNLEERGSNTLEDIIGYDDTGFYVLKRTEKGAALTFLIGSNMGMKPDYVIEKFDHNMNKVSTAALSMEHEGRKREMEGILHFQNKLLMFTTYVDKGDKEKELYIEEVDKKTLRVVSDRIELGKINFEGHTKQNSGAFDYVTSDDETKLFIYQSAPYEKRNAERFVFHVFDKELRELWSKEISLPYSDKEFEVSRYSVDNYGNVHILGRVFQNGTRLSRGGEANYRYHILSYRNGGEDMQEYKIGLEGKFLNDMQLAVHENRDLILAGFYSEDNPYSVSGSFYMTIDNATGQVKKQSLKAFDSDFITENMRERRAKKVKKKIAKGKNVELPNFDLRKLIRRKDGGVVLIGEQFYIQVVSQPTGQGGFITYTVYNYHDIMVVNINAEGEIDWARKIPKQQVTTDDGGWFSSYAVTISEDKLYFVFNDHQRNLDAEPGKLRSFSNQKNSVVVLGTLDASGKLEKKPLFINKEAGVLIRPKVCEQTTANEMIVFGERRKNQRFAKITFGAKGQAKNKQK